MKKRDLIITGALSLIIGFMYIFGLPLGLIPVTVMDIDAGCIPNFLNVMLCLLLIYTTIKVCRVGIRFGLTKDGLSEGIKNTLPIGLFYILGYLVANTINSLPLGNTPSLVRILVETVITVFFAAFLEEVLLRGLVLNLFAQLFKRSKHAVLISVVISSAFFAIGHVPSVINEGLLMCLFRFAYPFFMGVLFGAIYKKYGNLWIPVIYHFVLNCLSMTVMLFGILPIGTVKPVSMVIIMIISIVGGVYGIISAVHQDRKCS